MATLTRLPDASDAAVSKTPAAAPVERLDAPVQDEDVMATTVPTVAAFPQNGHGTLVPESTPSPMAAAAPPSQPPARTQSVADTSIRVDVGLLDMLMDQVGELVLARNRIMQFATNQEDRTLLTAYQRLDLITSELQEGVMKTRMQPIGTIGNKFRV